MATNDVQYLDDAAYRVFHKMLSFAEDETQDLIDFERVSDSADFLEVKRDLIKRVQDYIDGYLFELKTPKTED